MASKTSHGRERYLDRSRAFKCSRKKAGIIISHTAAMQLIKQEPKAIRFQTLDALCQALDCNPWDLIEYKANQKSKQDKQVAGENYEAIRPYARKAKIDEAPKNNIYPEEDF